MGRRRGFRQGPRREQFWTQANIGDDDTMGHFSCPTNLAVPGEQAFFPLVVRQSFAPAPGFAPFKKERITVLRIIIQCHVFGNRGPLADPVGTEWGRALRWAICKLDEEAVADPTHAFGTLFYGPGEGMPFLERVLQMGQLSPREMLVPASPGIGWQRYDDINVDTRLQTALEVGDSLWLVIETDLCLDAPGGEGALRALGWVRCYSRE